MMSWLAMMLYYDTGLKNSQQRPWNELNFALCSSVPPFTQICICTCWKGGPRMAPTPSPNYRITIMIEMAGRCLGKGPGPWTSCALLRRRIACAPCTCACDAGSTDRAGCLRWRSCLQEVTRRRSCEDEPGQFQGSRIQIE